MKRRTRKFSKIASLAAAEEKRLGQLTGLLNTWVAVPATLFENVRLMMPVVASAIMIVTFDQLRPIPDDVE